jgi:hypothetical protein
MALGENIFHHAPVKASLGHILAPVLQIVQNIIIANIKMLYKKCPRSKGMDHQKIKT